MAEVTRGNNGGIIVKFSDGGYVTSRSVEAELLMEICEKRADVMPIPAFAHNNEGGE